MARQVLGDDAAAVQRDLVMKAARRSCQRQVGHTSRA
jgi:hypothetical protein